MSTSGVGRDLKRKTEGNAEDMDTLSPPQKNTSSVTQKVRNFNGILWIGCAFSKPTGTFQVRMLGRSTGVPVVAALRAWILNINCASLKL